MDPQMAGTCYLFAEAFRYPAPGHMALLKNGLQVLSAGSEKQCLSAFLDDISRLSLGDWEELHTRTLDLNPPAAPYVGFQIWGESYQRGVFLAKMSREIMETGIDADGELPDHLIPILRYLAQSSSPDPELIEVINPAIQRMIAALRKVDSANPYLYLLEGLQSLTKNLQKEAV